MSAVKELVSRLNPEIRKHLEVLRGIAGQLIGTASYLDATNEISDTSKLNSSFSGHTVQMLRSATAHSCIMAVCRFWDDELPVRTAISMLEHAEKIEIIRSSNHPHWAASALEIGSLRNEISATISLSQKQLADNAYKGLRVYRTEYLAHNSYKPSRDRKKHFGKLDVPLPRFGELVDISRNSLLVFDRLISHWEFHVECSDDSFEIQKSYSKMFWDALPVFEDVENLDLLHDP